METVRFIELASRIKSRNIPDLAALCKILDAEEPDWNFILRWRSEFLRESGTRTSSIYAPDWKDGVPLPTSWGTNHRPVLGIYRDFWLEEIRKPVGTFRVLIVEEVVTAAEYAFANNHSAPHFLRCTEQEAFGTHQCEFCGEGTEEDPEPKWENGGMCFYCGAISMPLTILPDRQE